MGGMDVKWLSLRERGIMREFMKKGREEEKRYNREERSEKTELSRVLKPLLFNIKEEDQFKRKISTINRKDWSTGRL